MITIQVIPAATATEQQLLVEIEECLCTSYCINALSQPSATITFNAGEVTLVNGFAVVPIVATLNVTMPNSGCGCVSQKAFVEKAEVAFAAGTTNQVTLGQGASVIVKPSRVRCCKARGIKATTTLTVSIA